MKIKREEVKSIRLFLVCEECGKEMKYIDENLEGLMHVNVGYLYECVNENCKQYRIQKRNKKDFNKYPKIIFEKR